MNRAVALLYVLVAICIAGLLLLAVSIDDAHAQVLCAPTPDLLAGLQKTYGENPVWTGRAGESRMVLTVAPSGKWTLVEIKPGGDTACMVGAGDEAKDPRGREI